MFSIRCSDIIHFDYCAHYNSRKSDVKYGGYRKRRTDFLGVATRMYSLWKLSVGQTWASPSSLATLCRLCGGNLSSYFVTEIWHQWSSDIIGSFRDELIAPSQKWVVCRKMNCNKLPNLAGLQMESNSNTPRGGRSSEVRCHYHYIGCWSVSTRHMSSVCG